MKTSLKKSLIVGMNADYSPRFFFIHNGIIYQKQNFEQAYKSQFKYKAIDRIKGFIEIPNKEAQNAIY